MTPGGDRTSHAGCPVESVDVASTWLSENGNDLRMWAHYREHDPVSLQRTGDELFWSVTRYDDVVHVLRHPEVFTSEKAPC